MSDTVKFTAEFDGPIAPAASKTNERYAMKGARVVASGGKAWALSCDGRRFMAIEATKSEGEGVAIVPPEVAGTAKGGVALSVNGSIEAQDIGPRGPKGAKRIGEPDEGTFPPVGDVMPDVGKGRPYVAVTLNPKFLADLAALANGWREGGITLMIPADGEADENGVKVCGRAVAVSGPRGIGVIMPITQTGGSTGYTEALAKLKEAKAI